MAKNFRLNDPQNDLRSKLIGECGRQFESCLYASTALYEWLKIQRFYQRTFIVLHVILTNFGTWYILHEQSSNPLLQWLAAGCTLAGSLAFAIRKALKFDPHLDRISQSATTFANLRDRFRQAAEIYSLKPIEEFEAVSKCNWEDMEKARINSLAIPDKYLKKAKAKIERGDYSFGVDKNKTSNS